MFKSRFCAALLVGAASIGIARSARAVNYPDTVGEAWGSSAANDIQSVDITSDSQQVTFKVNLPSGADLASNYFPNFEFGLQTNGGAGGQTAINRGFALGDPTVGNPYGTPVGISTGMNFFIGMFPDGYGNGSGSPPSYSGGAELFQYSSATGWSKIGSTASISEVPNGANPSIQFSFLLSALGLNAGNSFNFDAWATYGGNNSAYDALDNPQKTFNGTSNVPYASGGNDAAPYDSATAAGSTFSATSFTVTVPEPASAALLLTLGACLIGRRRSEY